MALIPKEEYIAKHGVGKINSPKKEKKEGEEKDKNVVCLKKDSSEKAASRRVFDLQENWFAMRVDINKELLVRDFLLNRAHYTRGYSDEVFEKKEFLKEVWDPDLDPKLIVPSYVATQYVHKRYSDRPKWRERVIISGIVFVKIKNSDRNEKIFKRDEIKDYVKFFIVDKNTHKPDPIPETQMELLMSFIENNIEIVDMTKEPEPEPEPDPSQIVAGKKVKIVKGLCAGKEGVLTAVRTRNVPAKDLSGKVLRDITGEPIMEKKIELELQLNNSFSQRFLVLLSEVKLFD